MRFFTTIYILLLSYIVSALVFWGFSLHKQSVRIYQEELLTLNAQVDSVANHELYEKRRHDMDDKLERRTKQYIGEGSTFLVVILFGAAIVYTSLRRNIRLSKQQNNFMLSVTHELKSPIAAMKLNLQTLEKYKLDEEKKNTLITRCITESDRLNDLCNNMLIASQMEGRQYKAVMEDLSLHQFLVNTINNYNVRYPSRIQEGEIGECIVKADKLLLQMAINNLIENAIKYTPSDRPITISLSIKGKVASIRVADQGAGIPDKEKQKIFNKFYRIGNEETRKSKGTGLGLYLTSKIVRQHNGLITVKDNEPNGSVFEIALPLA